MDATAPRISWTLLTLLDSRFAANLEGLVKRYPELTQKLENFAPKRTYHILPTADAIQLGASNGPGITPIQHTLSPAAAKNLVRQLYPTAHCNQPVLIVGEDMGWLWNSIYLLPCQSPVAPGHRPPLFFLIKDIERLWVTLHIHDWRAMLADHRIRLFVGDDAMDQFRQSLVNDPACPAPRISVRVDPMLWSGSPTLDEILAESQTQTSRAFIRCNEQSRIAYSGVSVESIAARLHGGQPLKILGITSRYTTFLQYSMRDWLKSFERLGHTTRLVIEEHDHQMCNTLSIASACSQFQPDLIVIIDHYRKELGGMPEQAPVVMWVQDALPNIFRPEAGAAQGPLDYAIGFARMRMIHEFGYPADRYMPAVVGCDEERFHPQPLSMQEQGAYGCDISFVSHASTPADMLLSSEIDRAASREASRLLHAIYDQLRAVYDGGGIITEPAQIQTPKYPRSWNCSSSASTTRSSGTNHCTGWRKWE